MFCTIELVLLADGREQSATVLRGVADSSSLLDANMDTPPILTAASAPVDDVHPTSSLSSTSASVRLPLPSKVWFRDKYRAKCWPRWQLCKTVIA